MDGVESMSFLSLTHYNVYIVLLTHNYLQIHNILEATGVIQMWLVGPKIDSRFDDDVRKSFEYSDVHFCCGVV
jgi:hypothetical protein